MRWLAVASAVLAAGCTFHFDRNAPGRSSIATPPAQVTPQRAERPEDPGENVLLTSIGGFTGLGFRAGGDNNGAHESGIELSIDLGETETSHIKPDLFPFPAMPKRRVGINIGLVIAEATRAQFDASEIGPLYVEAHWARLFTSLSAGYSYDVRDDSHGPQATVMGYGFYAKASYRFERGLDVTFGIAYKIPFAWVWSR